MAETLLRALDVRVDYRTPAGVVTAISGVTLDVPSTGITVLAGPSGSGKSTLLRVLSLVEKPASGEILLSGKSTVELSAAKRRALRRKDIALVFQNPADNLIVHLTAGDNLRAAAQAAGRSVDVDAVLEQLGLPGVDRWKVPALSGGQQQRLAFGCALARGASVVLADEPTSQLDSSSADLVLDTLRTLPVPVVVASHDPRLISLAHKTYRMAAA